MNARSIHKNIENIKCFLGNLNLNFDVIAISETWLCDGKVQDINIPGYEVTHQLRLDKKGGGCSIFVKEDCKFKVLKEKCFSVNNLLECCTIEIINDKGKNAIVSCIYRSPDSHMVEFNKHMESYLNEMRSMNKNVYLCGDFNIDLLKCSNHKETKEFIDVMYGHGFYPLITCNK